MANEDLLLRRAPHSVEGEQAVLGSMLIDAECVGEVMRKLRPSDFYLRQNKEIFETVFGMFTHSKPIDALTVAGEMQRNGTYEGDATRSYLAQLMEITPTSANVMEYAKIVAEKALLRAIGDAAAEITAMVQEGGGDADAILEAAEQKIYAIRRGRSASAMTPVRETLPHVLDHLGELSENGGEIPGLSTGLSAIDAKICGLNAPDLVLLAARPGMGKTALAVQIARSAAWCGEKAVAVFSLEMTNEQVVTRLLSMEALVDGIKLKTGALEESDWEKIAAATVTISRMDICTDDNPCLTIAEMNAKCRRIQNLGLVVVDYMQLVESGGRAAGRSENRTQAVTEISRALKLMAKELNVPVLCLSQLSRANEKRDNKRPMLSDLRESGAIEQDADVVMFLYREGYYNEDADEPNLAECIVAKNRHGETGKVKLQWVPEYTMFSAIEERNES